MCKENAEVQSETIFRRRKDFVVNLDLKVGSEPSESSEIKQ